MWKMFYDVCLLFQVTGVNWAPAFEGPLCISQVKLWMGLMSSLYQVKLTWFDDKCLKCNGLGGLLKKKMAFKIRKWDLRAEGGCRCLTGYFKIRIFLPDIITILADEKLLPDQRCGGPVKGRECFMAKSYMWISKGNWAGSLEHTS